MRPSSLVTICGVIGMALANIFGTGCNEPARGEGEGAGGHGKGVLPKPAVDIPAGDLKPGETRTAVLASGCFWCTEAVFEQLEGIHDVTSGYAGGTKETADYRTVCNGTTGHAEAVRVTYEPAKISYGQLLRVFFATHDPTTKDRQGPDSGPQYRSAIFPATDDEKRVAEAYLKQLEEAKAYDKPVVTTIEPLKPEGFYPAEAYHQDYAACNPTNPYIRSQAMPKVKKVREKFADQLKGATPAAAGSQTKPAEAQGEKR